MKSRKLFTLIFPSFLIIILIAVILLGSYESGIIRKFYIDTVISDMKVRADLITNRIIDNNLLSMPEKLQKECIQLSRIAGVRITIIRNDGKVLNDSHKNPELMDNHKDRPEIIKALSGNTGHSIRYSYTLKRELLYLAVPCFYDNNLKAVVRVAIPFSDYQKTLLKYQLKLIWGGLIILFLSGIVSYLISKGISRPIEEIKKGADRFAKGDFSLPVDGTGTKEITALADTMNLMAKQLDQRIRTISMQQKEQEAMLRSMKEGILAVDKEEKIIKINKAASVYLGIDRKDINKKHVYEVIRHKEILEFIDEAMGEKNHLEKEVVIEANEYKVLLLSSDLIKDESEHIFGSVIVINDITRIKQWDKIRMEFVANVSHELKTPITSIKGYVETLARGKVRDKDTTGRFLNIILRQAERMNSIIDDLLELSKLEQQGSSELKLERIEIPHVIRSAVQQCIHKAEEKNICIDIESTGEAAALADGALLEQALINLIDNAVKYSDENSKVLVFTREEAAVVIIEIKDWGCGIPEEHQSRIFERFYRVDKGRSRELGGTGLGLSIVKHIILAHKGKIYVRSVSGQGSTFTIVLNKA